MDGTTGVVMAIMTDATTEMGSVRIGDLVSSKFKCSRLYVSHLEHETLSIELSEWQGSRFKVYKEFFHE